MLRFKVTHEDGKPADRFSSFDNIEQVQSVWQKTFDNRVDDVAIYEQDRHEKTGKHTFTFRDKARKIMYRIEEQ